MRVIRPYKEHRAVELPAYYLWEYRLGAAEIITMTTRVAVGRPSEGEVPVILHRFKPYDQVVASLTPVRVIILVDELPESVAIGTPITVLRHVACLQKDTRHQLSGRFQDTDVIGLAEADKQRFLFNVPVPEDLQLVLDCAHHLS